MFRWPEFDSLAIPYRIPPSILFIQKHCISYVLEPKMSAPTSKRIIDLSHPLAHTGLTICVGHPTFTSEQVMSLARDGTNVSRLTLGSHTGTHLDAPLHFLEGAAPISDVDISSLVGPA